MPASAVRTETRTSPPDSTKRTWVEPPLLSGTCTRISRDEVGGAAGGSMTRSMRAEGAVCCGAAGAEFGGRLGERSRSAAEPCSPGVLLARKAR